MCDQFLGEIRMVGFNYAPEGWALCNGQLLKIAENTALFSLLGTTYGGDGNNTFALPDLRGRVAIHQGSGSGLTPHLMGDKGGFESVTLAANEMPAHNHKLKATTDTAGANSPGGNALATLPRGTSIYGGPQNLVDMASQAVDNAGGGQAHHNMQPFLVVNFIIALTGLYPSRS